MENNDIIFTIGRMNPSTTGHMKLIEKMMVTALETDVKKIFIILSGTVDHEKNPLECVDKRKLLLEFVIDKVKNHILDEKKYTNAEINKINIEIVCMNDPRIKPSNSVLHTILFMIKENNPSNIQLIIGEDRKTDYDWIKNFLPKTVNFLTPMDVTRPEDATSATKIRNLAIAGNFDEFRKEMIPTGIDTKNIKEIYDTIRKQIVPKSKKTKRTSESTEKTKKTKKIKAGKKTYKKKRIINK